MVTADTFPKPFMKLSELMRMGLPEELLLRAYRDKTQTFATRVNPAAGRSHIVFETAGLAEWWNRQVSACVKGMPR